MPAAYVAKVARETGRSVGELEAHWKRAEAIVQKQYGSLDKHYGAVMTIFKNMAHAKESVGEAAAVSFADIDWSHVADMVGAHLDQSDSDEDECKMVFPGGTEVELYDEGDTVSVRLQTEIGRLDLDMADEDDGNIDAESDLANQLASTMLGVADLGADEAVMRPKLKAFAAPRVNAGKVRVKPTGSSETAESAVQENVALVANGALHADTHKPHNLGHLKAAARKHGGSYYSTDVKAKGFGHHEFHFDHAEHAHAFVKHVQSKTYNHGAGTVGMAESMVEYYSPLSMACPVGNVMTGDKPGNEDPKDEPPVDPAETRRRADRRWRKAVFGPAVESAAGATAKDEPQDRVHLAKHAAMLAHLRRTGHTPIHHAVYDHNEGKAGRAPAHVSHFQFMRRHQAAHALRSLMDTDHTHRAAARAHEGHLVVHHGLSMAHEAYAADMGSLLTEITEDDDRETMDEARKGKLGSGKRFAAMVKHLKAEKHPPTDPGAVAAVIGRRAHGSAKMAQLAAVGRRRHEDAPAAEAGVEEAKAAKGATTKAAPKDHVPHRHNPSPILGAIRRARMGLKGHSEAAEEAVESFVAVAHDTPHHAGGHIGLPMLKSLHSKRNLADKFPGNGHLHSEGTSGGHKYHVFHFDHPAFAHEFAGRVRNMAGHSVGEHHVMVKEGAACAEVTLTETDEDMMSGDVNTGVVDDTHMVVAGSPGMQAQDLKLKPNDVQHYAGWKPMRAEKATKYGKPVYSGKLSGGGKDHHVFDMGKGMFHAFPTSSVRKGKHESVEEDSTSGLPLLAPRSPTSVPQLMVPNQVAAVASTAQATVAVVPMPADTGIRKPHLCDYTIAAFDAALRAAGIPVAPLKDGETSGVSLSMGDNDGDIHWRWVDHASHGDRTAGEVRVAAALGGLRWRTEERQKGSGDWHISPEPLQDYRAAGDGSMTHIQPDEVEDRTNKGNESVQESEAPAPKKVLTIAQKRVLDMMRRLGVIR